VSEILLITVSTPLAGHSRFNGRYRMEPSILFAGLVGAVGVLHLLTKGVNFAQRYFFSSKSAHQQKIKTTRSDWYVFFAWSDLVGTDAGKKVPTDRDNDGLGSRVVSTPRKAVRKPARRPAARLVAQ